MKHVVDSNFLQCEALRAYLSKSLRQRLIPLSQVDQYLGLAGRSRNRAEFDFFGRC